MSVPAAARRYFRAPNLASPPAVWAAFQDASAFKSWMLILQAFVIAFLLVLVAAMAKREPDVVVVKADGEATYVGKSVEESALRDFLRAQKGQPTSAEVLHFAKDFVNAAVALNASTVRSAWPEALSMMSEPARARAEAEAKASRLVETFEASGQRTELSFESAEAQSRTKEFIALKLQLKRTRSRLSDGASPVTDGLEVSLLLHLRDRTREAPSGLEVAEWRIRAEAPSAPAKEGAAQ